MSHRLVARRYAKALAGIAEDQDALLKLHQELAAVGPRKRLADGIDFKQAGRAHYGCPRHPSRYLRSAYQ